MCTVSYEETLTLTPIVLLAGLEVLLVDGETEEALHDEIPRGLLALLEQPGFGETRGDGLKRERHVAPEHLAHLTPGHLAHKKPPPPLAPR